MLTDYQKFMKQQLKKLKDEHPTMKQPQLMKLAAKGWKKQSGGKKRKSSKRKSSKRSQRR